MVRGRRGVGGARTPYGCPPRDQRLVYGYEMRLDDRKISVSLATIELAPADEGTRLKVTEQGAFLDGYMMPESVSTAPAFCWIDWARRCLPVAGHDPFSMIAWGR